MSEVEKMAGEMMETVFTSINPLETFENMLNDMTKSLAPRFEVVSKYADCGVQTPVRETKHAAGYDLAAAEDIIIPPYFDLHDALGYVGHEWEDRYIYLDEIADMTKSEGLRPTLVSTGLKTYIPENMYLELVPRSSLPLKHWLIMANSVGVIDADYYNNSGNEGEIFVQLINLSPYPIMIRKGEKIAQGIFHKYEKVWKDEAEGERTGGFGSTTAKE